MQQQSFPPIQETETEKVVVDKSQERPHHNVKNAEMAVLPLSAAISAPIDE